MAGIINQNMAVETKNKTADYLSMATTPIILFNDDQPICSGTGFYYNAVWGTEKHAFLVTNYHVVSGNDDVPERKDLPKGNRLMFYTHIDEKNPGTVLATTIPIRSESTNLWLEHDNKIVDIAVLPIVYSLPVSSPLYGIDDNYRADKLNIAPSDLITLVGYPKMFCDKKNALPVYKTGHVASEPEFDFDGNPCFLIDISAYSGNSGSPVFAINNNFKIEGNELKVYERPTKSFLGIYSAQYEENEILPVKALKSLNYGVEHKTDMQLGVVWKRYLIDEIINKNNLNDYKKIVEEIFKSSPFRFKIDKGFIDF